MRGFERFEDFGEEASVIATTGFKNELARGGALNVFEKPLAIDAKLTLCMLYTDIILPHRSLLFSSH